MDRSGGGGGQAHFSFHFRQHELRTLRVRNMRSDPVVSEPVEARIRRVISSVSGMSCAHFVSRWTDPVVVSEPVEARIRRVISSVSGMSCALSMPGTGGQIRRWREAQGAA